MAPTIAGRHSPPHALPGVIEVKPPHSPDREHPRNTCASPDHSTAQTARPHRTVGLSPQSQSFSRSYGSILPTSLTYIGLSTRGCSPWRPAAVMSTTRGVNKTRPRVFKGRSVRTRHLGSQGALPPNSPYRRQNRFQGQSDAPAAPQHIAALRRPQALRVSTRKENSSWGTPPHPRACLCHHTISTSRSGNINPVPFR